MLYDFARSRARLLPRATFALAALSVAVLAACGGDDDQPVEPTPTTLALERIGGFEGVGAGAAEITAFDATSRRLFVVNGANGTVDVLDLSTPAAPRLVGSIDISSIGAGVNSVAVHAGIVALAVEAPVKTDPGPVAFDDAAELKVLRRTVKVPG